MTAMLEQLQTGLVTLVLMAVATLIGFGIRWVKAKLELDKLQAVREEEGLLQDVVRQQVRAKEQRMRGKRGGEKKQAVEMGVRGRLAELGVSLAKGAAERMLKGMDDQIEAEVGDINALRAAMTFEEK